MCQIDMRYGTGLNLKPYILNLREHPIYAPEHSEHVKEEIED